MSRTSAAAARYRLACPGSEAVLRRPALYQPVILTGVPHESSPNWSLQIRNMKPL